MRDKKVAVVLFNLGGPLAPEDVKPFLFNFFMDENIIGAPKPIRFFIAKYIAAKRGAKNGAAQTSYRLLGGKSPLLENTRQQASALEEVLKKDMPQCRVFVSMNYWHPRADAVAEEVKSYNPEKVILLPLYPQFSTTTTKSSFEGWHKVFKGKCREICCYPTDAGFIDASVALIRQKLQEAPAGTRLLFSAHGLPVRVVQGGDPYQFQCEKTVAAIVDSLQFSNLDWRICYQSRLGPLQWIGPSIEEEIRRAAEDKVAGVLVYPLAFVSEHVETLVEIDVEYRHKAQALSIPFFDKVPTVGTHPTFIAGLKSMVLYALEGNQRPKVCEQRFCKCWRELQHG